LRDSVPFGKKRHKMVPESCVFHHPGTYRYRKTSNNHLKQLALSSNTTADAPFAEHRLFDE
ncbi:MAG: hypothetical protein IKZ10_07615, partial [Akkermansia sp.]|nr:hypothetical protein [Akkermansia sp.]